MFHGNKKKDKKPLTDEEIKKIEEKLEKIKAIQNKLLEMKSQKLIDEKYLDFLLKAATLMSDSSTIWNYRKQIIEHMHANNKEEDFYAFLQKELKVIIPIMLSNPKSYVLWYHR
jgi:hypothetical protein